MINKDLLIWASDLSANTGEGILARNFLDQVQKIKKYKNIKIKTLENNFTLHHLDVNKVKFKQKNKKTTYHKYFGPIYGAFYLFFNRGKNELMYLNYLPYWNFLVFLILPKKTILGPITGGIYKQSANNLNLIIRKYLFPLFYKISKIIIYNKFKKVIFSTNILSNFIKKDKTTLVNFVEIIFQKKKIKIKKNNDIIFYNRNHITKYSDNIKETIIHLSKFCKICIVGDKFDAEKINNLGWIPREKVYNIIDRSKIAFNSSENFLSIFSIDCINRGVFIIYDKNIKSFVKNKNCTYIAVNFNNIQIASVKILRLLKTLKIKDNSNWWKKINKRKNKIKYFLKEYLSR